MSLSGLIELTMIVHRCWLFTSSTCKCAPDFIPQLIQTANASTSVFKDGGGADAQLDDPEAED
jgi:hypothetical protein